MSSFQKSLQKFLVYFFTSVSVLLVILGIQRVKQGDAPRLANEPNGSNGTGSTKNISGLASSVRSNQTVTAKGKNYQTPWGTLATTIKVKDGKVIAIDIPQLPDSPPSIYAKQYLIDQALASGGANIQGVSGATITSNAFKASLESAIAQALAQDASQTDTQSTSQPAETFAVTATNPTAIARNQQNTNNTTSSTAPSVSGTFTGNAYQTPWGNAVASVTYSNGKLSSIDMPQVPDSPPSIQAKAYLVDQAIRSGSANIQGVSGATITSRAFKASLENALTKASASGAKTAQTTASNQIQIRLTQTVAPTNTNSTQTTTASNKNIGTSANVSGTFTGNAYQTPWGNAVASATFTNGKITGIAMPQVPNSPPSIQAKPYLISQALSAGGANIQGVSGATYASLAFKSSLESAIAKASVQGTVSTPTTTNVQSTQNARTTVTRTYHDNDNDDDNNIRDYDNDD